MAVRYRRWPATWEEAVTAMPDQPLIGRSAERSRLRALIDADDSADRALAVLGDAGIGKTALLSDLAAQASARGLRVLFATGRERESACAFAGLRQLLRPVLVELLALPGREAEELRAALGMHSCDARLTSPDRFAAGAALFELLSGHLGPASGVLVLVDDAQWVDGASLDVLALATGRLATGRLATGRLDGGPVAMIIAARGNLPPEGFPRGVPELRVDPLTVAGANELLDAQPHPPQGRARAQVLAQAEGNPLALIELTRAITADPGAVQREIAQRLFLSPRTVASHLYRSFPKLGVAGRHQLHGLVAQAAPQTRVARQSTARRTTTVPNRKEPSI